VGGKASRTPILRGKNENGHPRPYGGNDWHNLENQNNEECKLKLENANWNENTRGTPPLWEGRGQKTGGQKAQQKKTGLGKCKCTPPTPLLLGEGAWNFFAGSIWKSGTLEITL